MCGYLAPLLIRFFLWQAAIIGVKQGDKLNRYLSSYIDGYGHMCLLELSERKCFRNK